MSDVVAVGAIDASDPGNNDVQAFSSRGTSTIYTDFPNQVSVDRTTLDGVGIDGVQTRSGVLGYMPSPFFGTSAAAPHVAALAGLILDAADSLALTPSEVSIVLTSTAVDVGVNGGAGRFNALDAVNAALNPTLSWQNPVIIYDVNNDSFVSPIDYQIISNEINRRNAAGEDNLLPR